MVTRFSRMSVAVMMVSGVFLWTGCTPKDQENNHKNHGDHKHGSKGSKPSTDDLANINKLPEGDRPVATSQATCPVSGEPLGSMGVPLKITAKGRPVFLCCKGCETQATKDPDAVLKKISAK